MSQTCGHVSPLVLLTLSPYLYSVETIPPVGAYDVSIDSKRTGGTFEKGTRFRQSSPSCKQRVQICDIINLYHFTADKSVDSSTTTSVSPYLFCYFMYNEPSCVYYTGACTAGIV